LVSNEEQSKIQVPTTLVELRNLARKAALVAVGAAALTYEKGKATVADSAHLVDLAEQRGERIEQDLSQLAGDWEKQAVREARSLQELLAAQIKGHEPVTTPETKGVTATVDANLQTASAATTETGSPWETQLQQLAERVLVRVGVPTRNRLDELSRELQAMNAKLDAHLAGPATASNDIGEPLPDYATFSAKDVLNLLDGLELAQLEALRLYELAHANRVTVLRAVDEQISLRLPAA
jgi:hypothetical protein